MPQILNVTVTNLNTGGVWVTHSPADTAGLNWVACTAQPANQPPVGFFNNPAHQFQIQGIGHFGQGYISGALQINPALTDVPLVYVFT